ncbi:hypothetical protein ACT29H_15240 [Thermophagus sp. OGC60D27]|uniref:hypothetical protein n=1 Tax=Thermophagus sp. OGC60D27 TaxID=3458415 RepID=UPI0040378441
MKKSYVLLIISALILFSSCNPKISTSISRSYPPIDYKQDILVIGLDQSEPDNSEVLGQVKIGDTGFSSKCSYDIVIDKAKLEARKVGGNAIKIIKHRPPSALGSTCHRITAKILKVENIENYTSKDEEEDLLDVDYAIINVYRYSGVGALISYDLFLGDSVICRVRNNFKTTIHIKKEGLNSLWAKTEGKTEVPIDVKMGKTYYVRCGIKMGAIVGRPKLELVDSKTGKLEFESFKAKNQ